MKRKAIAILFALTIGFTLSACNSNSGNKDEATGEIVSGDTTEETTEETPSAETSAEETASTDTAEGQAEEEQLPDVSDEELAAFNEVYNYTADKLPQLNPEAGDNPTAVIKTNMGDVTVVLYPEYAPKAVENFLTHAKDGYYDGVKFHRIINDFMLQTGDPEGTGAGGESIFGEPFEDEFNYNLFNLRGAISMANSGPNTNGSQFFIVQAKNLNPYTIEGLGYLDADEYENEEDERVTRYVRANFPHYGFFGAGDGIPKLMIEKYLSEGGVPHLDHMHTVFGHVIEGMDIVDKIASVEVSESTVAEGEMSVPVEDVLIESIEVK